MSKIFHVSLLARCDQRVRLIEDRDPDGLFLGWSFVGHGKRR